MPISDSRPDPERSAIERQNAQLALRVLNGVSKRDREVLIRFYLKEQTAPEICRDMELTETQFRLIKSRAKARFGELGKSRLRLPAFLR
jgi:DNA-directed RNA polymerase specialized sigma24 family protein